MIYMFHRVLPLLSIDKTCPYHQRGTLVSSKYLRDFLENARLLGQKAITVRSYCDLYSKGQLQSNQIALSFDDGYLDNFLFAKPILDEFGIKASFYPTLNPILSQQAVPLDYYYFCLQLSGLKGDTFVDYISGTIKKDFIKSFHDGTWKNWIFKHYYSLLKLEALAVREDNLVAWLNESMEHRLYMNTQELMQLHSEGHEIGSHCLTHRSLNQITMNEAREELTQSLDWMKHNFGEQQITLAFPNGHFTKEIETLAKDLGYAAWLGVQVSQDVFSYANGFPRKFMRPLNKI